MKKLLLGTIAALVVAVGALTATDFNEEAGNVSTTYYDPGAGDDE